MNINFKTFKFFYFLGIGGIGMSAIARYFNSIGKVVYGHDKEKTLLTKKLEKEGIHINYKDNEKLIPKYINSDKCLIIYTSAIYKNCKQWIFLKKNCKNIIKRSKVLSLITQDKICIAIGGTHGKTTTCSLLAHIFYNSKINFTALLGGISENYKSNLILNGDQYFLIEADEFDHSFLYLNPNIACITSLDQDHIDIYPKKKLLKKAYINFIKKIKNPYKKIFLCKEDNIFYKNAIYYSINKKYTYYSDNIVIKNNIWYFDFHTPLSTWKSLTLSIPGLHNLKNFTAALSISDYLKIDQKKIRKSLLLFKGVERRYSIHYKSNKKIYIDDYAHHPTEISALIKTVNKCYPKKKILGIFQPHLFSRTKFFLKKFAKSLEKLDFIILLDIYPSRECPIENKHITSNILFDKIKNKNKIITSLSKTLKILIKVHYNFDIIITMGAGNIDTLINPIKQFLYKKYK